MQTVKQHESAGHDITVTLSLQGPFEHMKPIYCKSPAESPDPSPEGCGTFNALSKSELFFFSLLCNRFFLLVFQDVNIMLLTK